MHLLQHAIIHTVQDFHVDRAEKMLRQVQEERFLLVCMIVYLSSQVS